MTFISVFDCTYGIDSLLSNIQVAQQTVIALCPGLFGTLAQSFQSRNLRGFGSSR